MARGISTVQLVVLVILSIQFIVEYRCNSYSSNAHIYVHKHPYAVLYTCLNRLKMSNINCLAIIVFVGQPKHGLMAAWVMCTSCCRTQTKPLTTMSR